MLEAVKSLYDKNKVLFYLLLVPGLIICIGAILIPGIRSFLADRIRALVKDSTIKDTQLSKEADEANSKANEHLTKANEIRKQINDIPDDANWHKGKIDESSNSDSDSSK